MGTLYSPPSSESLFFGSKSVFARKKPMKKKAHNNDPMSQDHPAMEKEEEEEECPLFMMGLPTQSALDNNAGLAALVTLVDDGSDRKRSSKSTTKTQKNRCARRTGAMPYQKARANKRRYATVAEAQIYLSLM
jgi:hypothetical protein